LWSFKKIKDNKKQNFEKHVTSYLHYRATSLVGDYATTIGAGNMQNCMSAYYSCVGLMDGANAIPGGLIKNKYVMCQGGRTIDMVTCPNFNTYDPTLKICAQSVEQGWY